MTQATTPTMTTSVEVDVDSATAFAAFTDDFEHWWGNGPIDAWDSSRVVTRRIEPGVGGRLLEVYADDELELGRISVWEPGARLTWTSSVDDVTIDVTFEALDAGRTRVRVDGTATGPNAGEGFSFVRMVPQWLPRYLDRQAAGVTRPELGPLHVVLRYERPAATARWLVDAFGFEPTGDLPEVDGSPEQTWLELRVGNGEAAIILWGLEEGTVSSSDHSPWVYVDDLDAHLAHAEAAGATVITPIVHHGFRSYTAADCEGRHWIFAQSRPTM